MAKKVVTEIKIILDQNDINVITKHIGDGILEQIDYARTKALDGKWEDITCGLSDAFDWANILSQVRSGEIKDLESLTERIGRLDTAAREIWWEVLNPIWKSVQGNIGVAPPNGPGMIGGTQSEKWGM